jgi:hypothetical protein
MKTSLLFIIILGLLQNSLIAQKKYPVTFYANAGGSAQSWVGHVWVGFGEGKNEVVFGFYPGKSSPIYKGAVRNDKNTANDASYTFNVASEKYQAGLKFAQMYKSTYVLGVNDCRTFTSKVAEIIGLKTPSARGTKAPAIWLAELVDNNF